MSSAAMSTLTLQVPDIRCASCAFKIEDALSGVSGINLCRTNVANKQVIIEHDSVALPETSIQNHLRDLGFESQKAPLTSEDVANETRLMLTRLGVAGIGAMQVMMFALATYVSGSEGIELAYVKLMQWASFAVATPVALFCAVPFYRGALRDLTNAQVGMDVPVSLAILSAYSLSCYHLLVGGEVYFDSVCMFSFLLLTGRFLELRSQQRYRANVSLAERCLPDQARLLDGSLIATEAISVGDQVLVSTGETIPVDGEVTEGSCVVSEAAFTGETTPVRKEQGSTVLAGAQILEGEITVNCTSESGSSVVAGISDLYRNAMLYKPKFAILVDRIARYFVATILLTAVVSGGTWYLLGNPEWFVILITVLVVSCPCALALATPIAYTIAVTTLKQNGVVIRDGSCLEKLAKVDHIVFDKTGTLTEGNLIIEQIEIFDPSWSEDDVLDFCAALEAGNKHPIAKVFQRASKRIATQLKNNVGIGVSGVINDVEYRLGQSDGLGQGKNRAPGTLITLEAEQPIAQIRLNDEIRDSSKQLLARLHNRFTTTLLSGDQIEEVERVADQLGIEEFIGRQKPEDKLNFIQELGRKHTVLMAGDGFNDAAAMAASDVAVAVSPVDILVQEAADASLLRQDVLRLEELLNYARRLKAIVLQNIIWAVAYNFCLMPLAIVGLLEPWMAALGMSLSSLLVVMNAGRLQNFGES